MDAGMPGFVASSSEQSSVIVGDSITSRGGTAGSVFGPSPFLGGTCRAESRLFVHLRVETPMGFRSSSRAYCKAQVGMFAWGSSGSVVALEACEGPVVFADSIIESNASCDFMPCADSLLAGHSGTLPVGEYCLTVRSWILGMADENQLPEWTSSYEVILVFDARIVGSHAATWTDVKSMYR